MNAFMLQHELAIRLACFLGVFCSMSLWELAAPRRRLTVSKLLRWANNLALVVLNSILLRALFPAAAVGVAAFATQQGWGLFNYFAVPLWMAMLVSVVFLDFVIYLQHVMFHAVPLLWRLHRVHHADLDIDVTTGTRFHPIEIVLSMLIKVAVILVLGPPVVAVVIFEVLLNATSMFNHGNVHISPALDRVLRLLLVTPDMHRVHHSIEEDETNSNFAFNLSAWDRLFGTYRDQPRAGHVGMTIGISTFREANRCVWLWGILVLPFIGKVTDYAINRRRWKSNDAS
ncbi:sterol desaturase family protein [Candidatus Nitrotoga sp. 1052]|uniref:sterol desaturase family protein n=1 Tax=Candidatus Nitrotoga sp. 1052 TaxID=2886964 RepID=UPI001EF6FCEB|nr:sterol desaturase family protein [Candidatus Nitrotoga sp. 1052]CAH1090584.1 Fatty acid hydroxylase [Candidatus Nitrotoga sp. 1052]